MARIQQEAEGDRAVPSDLNDRVLAAVLRIGVPLPAFRRLVPRLAHEASERCPNTCSIGASCSGVSQAGLISRPLGGANQPKNLGLPGTHGRKVRASFSCKLRAR